MKTPPHEDTEAVLGLFCALLLSLESRGILKQSEFISDLDEIIDLAQKDKFLPPSTLSAISRLRAWLQDQPSRIKAK